MTLSTTQIWGRWGADLCGSLVYTPNTNGPPLPHNNLFVFPFQLQYELAIPQRIGPERPQLDSPAAVDCLITGNVPHSTRKHDSSQSVPP